MSDVKLTADPKMIRMWATRDKCWMCKHKFDRPVLLPVEKPQRGKFQPNYNGRALFHIYDTHGLDPEVVTEWIYGSIYGLERTEMGVRLPGGDDE